MTKPPTDGLLVRYQGAHEEHRSHRGLCIACTDTERCPQGQRLFESFSRLQDAYLNWQREQRKQG
ncbi:hypothetical protein [Streptomyces europaeiscabiei]|uniref:hypothetical protein n=1 Tax=Streptomyces europaeiscabiei TaxID=146819 RepID=UPI0029B460D0|nr:hypothetical protein [Streptomyces europaeiscabiei]MDX3697333.1 hypothetical protein [Streptomyces europaeiscabiei]